MHPTCHAELAVADIFALSMELNDEGRYEVRCNKGHLTIAMLQQEKFEVLFDLGAMALLDGYSREAVASMAASLERFYEFCTRIYLHKRGISLETVDILWKQVSKQSERQLGMYYATYLFENGEMPPVFSGRMVEFRNEVIHKGKIPKRSETVQYAEAILKIILPIADKLKEEYSEEINALRIPRLKRWHEELPKNSLPSGVVIPTLVNLSGKDSNANRSFEDLLKSLQSYRAYVYK